MDVIKIPLELTILEAKVLCRAISGQNPAKEDEMVAYMLYTRILTKLNEVNKNENL